MSYVILNNAVIVTGKRVGAGSVVIQDDRIRHVVFNNDPKPSLDNYPKPSFDDDSKSSLDDCRKQKVTDCKEAKVVPCSEAKVIDLGGKLLFAGGVDAHVHFREPGLTQKADIRSESRAALLGGVTSFIDMPNTIPPTIDLETLEEKAASAEGRAYANYGFHLGAAGDNSGSHPEAMGDNSGLLSRSAAGNSELLERAASGAGDKFAGIKLFMGSSTGNLQIADEALLDKIFSIRGKTLSVHCEDDIIIRENLARAAEEYGEDIPMRLHPQIRSAQACISSTSKALSLAMKHGTSLHILHVSTAGEIDMISRAKKVAQDEAAGKAGGGCPPDAAGRYDNAGQNASEIQYYNAGQNASEIQYYNAGQNASVGRYDNAGPRITAETTINYLWFCDKDYDRLGGKIKCNPAIKSEADRARLIAALRDGEIDTIGSDHAPHLASEKCGTYRETLSGIPSIQFTLPVLLTIAGREGIALQRIASAFSERPAEIFGIRDRGRIEEGCHADLVVVDPETEWTVAKEDIVSKCGWSPYEGARLKGKVEIVIVNGQFSVSGGKLVESGGIAAPDGKPADNSVDNTETRKKSCGDIETAENSGVGRPAGRRILFG